MRLTIPDGLSKVFNKLRTSGVIRPYFPTLASWCKSKILWKYRGSETQSGLYVVGQGSKKMFWYWGLDHGLQQYRTSNLAEAQKLYQQERFELWKSEIEETESSIGRGVD